MAEIDVLKAQLVRDGVHTPWGFRLQGGVDMGVPLTIQRIASGSPAARIGLKPGDEVTKIGDAVTKHMTHERASQVISQYGPSMILTVERSAYGSAPQYPVMMNPAAGVEHGYDMHDPSHRARPAHPRHIAGLQLRPSKDTLPIFIPTDVPPKSHVPRGPTGPFVGTGVSAPDGSYGAVSSGSYVPPPANRRSFYESPPKDVEAHGPVSSSGYEPTPPSARGPPDPQMTGPCPPAAQDGGFRNPPRRGNAPPPPDGQYAAASGGSFAPTPQAHGPPPPPVHSAIQQAPDTAESLDIQALDGGFKNPKPKPSNAPPPPDGEYGPVSSGAGGTGPKTAVEPQALPKSPAQPVISATAPPPAALNAAIMTCSPDPHEPGSHTPFFSAAPYQPLQDQGQESYQQPHDFQRAQARPFEAPHRPHPPPPPAPEPHVEYRPQPQHGAPPPQQYSNFADEEENTGLQQSRTFKILQSLMDNNGEPPPPVLFARKPSTPGAPTAVIAPEGPGSNPRIVENKQFNTPIGLYNKNVAIDTMSDKIDSVRLQDKPTIERKSETPAGPKSPAGPKPYVASATMKLVQQMDEEEKVYGRPNYPPPKSSKPPVGRVLDDVPQTASPSSTYVPNYQNNKALAHVFRDIPSDEVRRTSTGSLTPERRPSTGTSKGFRKVEYPNETQSVPQTRSLDVMSDSGYQTPEAMASPNSQEVSQITHAQDSPSYPYQPRVPSATREVHTEISSTSQVASIHRPTIQVPKANAPLTPDSSLSNLQNTETPKASPNLSKIESVLRPKIRPYQRPSFSDTSVETTVKPVSSPFRVDGSTTSGSTQKIHVSVPSPPPVNSSNHLVEIKGSYIKATEDRAEHFQSTGSPVSTIIESQARATVTIPSTTIQPEQAPLPTTNTGDLIVSETRKTITIPSSKEQIQSSGPEVSSGDVSITVQQSGRHSIIIPSNDKVEPEVKPSMDDQIIQKESVRNKINVPSKSVDIGKNRNSDIVTLDPRDTIQITTGANVVKVPELMRVEVNQSTVVLNEAPRKTIKIPEKFSQTESVGQSEPPKGKLKKLASMFEKKEEKSPPIQRKTSGLNRSLKMPDVFKQDHDSNGFKERNTSSEHASEFQRPLTNGGSAFRVYGAAPINAPAEEVPEPISPDYPPPDFCPPPPPISCHEDQIKGTFPPPPPPLPNSDCPVSPTSPDFPPPPPAMFPEPTPAAAPAAATAEKEAQPTADLYKKYEEAMKDAEDKGPVQSRTFNALSNMMESEPEPAAGSQGLPPPRSAYQERRRAEGQAYASPRVKVFMPQQYNTPLGMYSAQNVVETFQGQAERQLETLERQPDVYSGAHRAVLEDDHGYGAHSTSDF